MKCRQGRPAERPQRGEALCEARRDQLEELLGARNVLQAVTSEGAERDAGGRLVPHEVARRAGHDDLTTVRRRADPRRDDDVHPHVPLLAEVGLARMDPDPEPHHAVGRPRLARERALELRRGKHRIPRPPEDEEYPVSCPVDLPAAVGAGGVANELAEPRPHRSEVPTQRVEEARRSLDVGEEQRHRPAR